MNVDLDKMLKAQQWERTKGELKAMIAMKGAYRGSETSHSAKTWEQLCLLTATFIKQVEDEGLIE